MVVNVVSFECEFFHNQHPVVILSFRSILCVIILPKIFANITDEASIYYSHTCLRKLYTKVHMKFPPYCTFSWERGDTRCIAAL